MDRAGDPLPGGYSGRFAPSPTGPLHFGSLVAAVASYADARAHGGRWLLRIEDIDPPREPAGASADIVCCLEAHGLHWDGPVLYQRSRQDHYGELVHRLLSARAAYFCSCTRSRIQAVARDGLAGPVYPETCRNLPPPVEPPGDAAVRLRTDDTPVEFTDRLQGHRAYRVRSQFGDFVLRRRDGLYAYALAVVADDAAQGITDVVRGADLLDVTALQLCLQRVLGLPTPRYAHVPLALNAAGEKLSKQTLAAPVDPARPGENLARCLRFLHHPPPDELAGAAPGALLAWLSEHWNPGTLRGITGAPENPESTF